MVTHLFACTRRGYVGWRWSVTVTRASRHKAVTVDEVVLIPGDEAIVAPAWVPYRERIQPGDLSPGDLLPVSDEDPRLVPTYSFGDDPLDTDDKAQIREVAQDLGLGRVRTLSVEGRELAAQRWYDGDGGPDSPLAQSAPHHCRSCGFLVRIAGPLTDTFGVCANGDANDDGRVVSVDHGCGAHSEVRLAKKHEPQPLPGPRLRHPQHRRGRELLARGGCLQPRLFGLRARRGCSGAGGSTPARTARARSRPGRSRATRCARRPRAGCRTAAAPRSRSARRGCRPRSVRTPSTSRGSTSATMKVRLPISCFIGWSSRRSTKHSLVAARPDATGVFHGAPVLLG